MAHKLNSRAVIPVSFNRVNSRHLNQNWVLERCGFHDMLRYHTVKLDDKTKKVAPKPTSLKRVVKS